MNENARRGFSTRGFSGGGRGLVEYLYQAVEKHGITVRYGAQAKDLLRGPAGIEGVRLVANGREEVLRARSVVLACGW